MSDCNTVIDKINNLSKRLASEGKAIMVEEAPRRKTGHLKASIFSEEGDNYVFIGTSLFYAKFVELGRGVVKPVTKKALCWEDLPHPVGRARPSKPNDFVGRTARRIRPLIHL